jgi:hypothetical protein
LVLESGEKHVLKDPFVKIVIASNFLRRNITIQKIVTASNLMRRNITVIEKIMTEVIFQQTA